MAGNADCIRERERNKERLSEGRTVASDKKKCGGGVGGGIGLKDDFAVIDHQYNYAWCRKILQQSISKWRSLHFSVIDQPP